MQETERGQEALRGVSVVKKTDGCCQSVFRKLEHTSESPRALLRQITGSHPKFLIHILGPRSCISNKRPDAMMLLSWGCSLRTTAVE